MLLSNRNPGSFGEPISVVTLAAVGLSAARGNKVAGCHPECSRPAARPWKCSAALQLTPPPVFLGAYAAYRRQSRRWRSDYRPFALAVPSGRYMFPREFTRKLGRSTLKNLRFCKLRRHSQFVGGATSGVGKAPSGFSVARRSDSDRASQPAASGRPLRIAWQTMRSPFARVADFLRRKKTGSPWRWSLPADAGPQGRLTVIALISGDADRLELAGICSRRGWNLFFAGTLEEARTLLDKVRGPLILCDRDLPRGGWRSTVERLASSPHRACVILVSAVVDTYLWNEVVRTGGFDVLSKPFREDEVARAVRLAWSYWNKAAKPFPAIRKSEDPVTG